MESSQHHFCLADYDWIGFDMDHTLVRYKINNLQNMVFRACLAYLVEVAGYSAELLKAEFWDANFIKGCFCDKVLGNFVKLDAHRRVTTCYHGTRKYSAEEVARIYPEPVDFQGVTNERWYSCTSYFDMPYMYAFSLLVDLYDEKGIKSSKATADDEAHKYDDLNHDIFKAVIWNFGDWNGGRFFPEFRANVDKFIEKRPQVREWLVKLRESGIKLFLLTNSGDEFAELLMAHAFGADWRSLFDLVLLKGRKPYYFLMDAPYNEVKSDGTVDPVACTKLEFGKYYTGGSVKLFDDVINGGKVCYFGDELVGDNLVPQTAKGWDTVAIIEELEALEEEQGIDFGDNLNSDCFHHTEKWGTYFYASSTARTEFSYWGHVLKTYSNIYIPCVSRFALFPIDTKFKTHHTPDNYDKELVAASVTVRAENPQPVTNFIPTDLAALQRSGKAIHQLETKTEHVGKLTIERS